MAVKELIVQVKSLPKQGLELRGSCVKAQKLRQEYDWLMVLGFLNRVLVIHLICVGWHVLSADSRKRSELTLGLFVSRIG